MYRRITTVLRRPLYVTGLALSLGACGAQSADGVASDSEAITALPCLQFPNPTACFWVTNTLDTMDPGTLRRAIVDANSAGPIARRILFDIPAGVEPTIHPNSPLPVIQGDTDIQGFSQPGASPGTDTTLPEVKVVIDCENCTNWGLNLGGSNNRVAGLAIINVPVGSGIVTTGSNDTIVGNYLGVVHTAAGFEARPNSQAGLNLNGGSGHRVGGEDPADRNVISGSTVQGILAFTSDSVIEGNAIGTDFFGTQSIPNGGDGIDLYGDRNRVGGLADGARNFIAYNGGSGVEVVSGSGHEISRNSIHDNVESGIDLGGDGVTHNDGAPDADTGPNGLQNFPVVEAVTLSSGQVTIDYTLRSTPNTQFRAEFFRNPTCDASGRSEGELFMGSAANIHTDASGRYHGSVTFNTAVASGEFITATALSLADKSSSELSKCAEVP